MTTENLPEVPEKVTALEVYQAPNGLDPWIKKIRAEAESLIADVSTKKGREEIASMAYKISRSKTALDNLGKELVSELKELPKKIDAERARVRAELDALRDQVRQPLTDWEYAQVARVDSIKAAIAALRFEPEENSVTIRKQITNLESTVVDAENFEEFEVDALRAKEQTLAQLKDALSKRVIYEAEQAELEKLRAEAAAREQADKEARIAKEAEERAIKAAEEKAKAEREAIELKARQEREAAERRELELKLQAEKAEREKLEAQQRADKAIEEEKLRVKREAEKAEAERLKREADRAHSAAINRAAKEDFIAGGMTEECAILAVTLIAKKLIRNVLIDY